MGSSKNQNKLTKPRISNKTLDQKADSSLVSILKQSFNQLEAENKELKQRNEFLSNELKEHKDTLDQMIKEAWKLKELVDKLREAIEEPVELKDK